MWFTLLSLGEFYFFVRQENKLMGVPFPVDVNVVPHAEQVDALEKRLNTLQSKGVDLKVKVDGLDKLDTSKMGKQASQNFMNGVKSVKGSTSDLFGFAKDQKKTFDKISKDAEKVKTTLGYTDKESTTIAKSWHNTQEKASKEAEKVRQDNVKKTQKAQEVENRRYAQQQIAQMKQTAVQRNAHNKAIVDAGKERIAQLKQEQQLRKQTAEKEAVVNLNNNRKAQQSETRRDVQQRIAQMKQEAAQNKVHYNELVTSGKERIAQLKQEQKIQRQINEKESTANLIATRKAEQSRTQAQVQQKISQLGYDNRLKNAHNQEIMDRIQQTRQKYESQQSKLAKIQERITSGEFEARNAKTDKFLSRYEGQDSEVLTKARKYASELKSLQSELQSGVYASGDKKGLKIIPDDQVKLMDQINEKAKQLQNSFTEISNLESKTLGQGVAERSANNVATYMENNTKALKKYGEQLATLQQQYTRATTEFEKSDLDNQFKNLKSRISAEGLTGNSMWTELTRGFKQIGQFALTYGVIQNTAMQLPSKIISAVTDVDSAMTNLYKVTDETDQRYQKFLNNAGNTSKSLGRDMSSYINQTAEWAKLGYSLSDSEQLSKLSSIYANVGEVGDETAVSDMVTAMKAFNMQASDAQKIIDSYNRLGNEFAVTSADIGEGISNSASSLATASNDFDQSVAMITGMAEITQSANEGGSALKILAMRLRGYDEETQSYTNDIEELSGKVADLTKTAETPGGISLFTDDTKQTYKDTYTLMEDISKIYDKLSDKNRAELLEVIAGKNRGNQIAALIQAFQSGQVQKAYEASKNSEGSAQQEQERWLNSIEAKQQQFSSQFQKLSTDVLSSDFVKGAVDFGSGFLGFLDGAIKKIGIFKTAVGTAGIAKIIKSIA